MVKHLPAMQQTWVRSLGWEDLLEKAMAPHSSTLAWKIPRTEEPGRLQSMGSQRVGHDFTFTCALIYTIESPFTAFTVWPLGMIITQEHLDEYLK